MTAAPYRVLVVDDVPENLDVIGAMLDGKGIDLHFATSGAQALRSLEVSPPDLVLLDVAMPDMDGYEVARRLRTLAGSSGTPVIFITARAGTDDVLEGFRAGAVDYVTKPFNAAELVARVLTHLELKRSRDTILRQNEDLRSLNAAKDRFLSLMAHDLKNPVHGMMSLSGLLLDMSDGMDAAAKRGHLASLHATACQMAKTLSDLLDWSKVQRGAYDWNPVPFALAAVVQESMLLTQSAAISKGVEVRLQIAAEEKVYADPIMILTVVRNLLQNAVKYSRRRGEVSIKAERTGGEGVQVTVTDTGVGMGPAILASLFDIDARTSRPGTEGEKGTGMGLKFCQEFLSQHGSTLQVRSEEGKGTSFSFVLPISSPPAG